MRSRTGPHCPARQPDVDPLAAILVLAILALAAWQRRTDTRAFQAERDTWHIERQVLLERIQRPDIPPRLHVPPRHTSDEDKQRAAEALARQAALASVGTARPLRSADGTG